MSARDTQASLPWWLTAEERRRTLSEQRRARRGAARSESPSAAKAQVDPEDVVTVAVRIIDADGLDGLTIRRLAADLGMAPMTVYSYVGSKDELLDLVVDQVAAQVRIPTQTWPWRRRAKTLAHHLRDVLLQHPEGARLIGERPMRSPHAFRIFDAGLGIFRDAGFHGRAATDAYFAFGNYVLGAVAQETTTLRQAHPVGSSGLADTWSTGAYAAALPPAAFPNIAALAAHIHPTPDAEATASSSSAEDRFDFGLDSLLDGLAARLASGGPRVTR
ncbi:MAG: TetR/AcrR family transcriptional regulator C-terminal domain-containing protein [Dermatophilaceae bacterium]